MIRRWTRRSRQAVQTTVRGRFAQQILAELESDRAWEILMARLGTLFHDYTPKGHQ